MSSALRGRRLPRIALVSIALVAALTATVVRPGPGSPVAVVQHNSSADCPLGTVREADRGGDAGLNGCQPLGHPETFADLASRFGQEIAGELRDAGVQAVLLSGT